MHIQAVCNNNNQNFKAKLADTYTLRKIKAGLTPSDADKFEKYVNIIEKVKDDKIFAFDAFFTGNRRISKIHEIDKNGEFIYPPIYTDYGNNPLNPIKQLAQKYENYLGVKG